MRAKPNLVVLVLLIPLVLLWGPSPAEAGCSTTCSNGSSSSDLGGCECCCQGGDAVCDAKGGKCSDTEILPTSASPDEIASYSIFIHRLERSNSPKLRALAAEAQAIYDAVIFQDQEAYADATIRYRELRQALSPQATRELLAVREVLNSREVAPRR